MRLAALITLLLPLTASAQFQGPDIAEIDRQAAENRRALELQRAQQAPRVVQGAPLQVQPTTMRLVCALSYSLDETLKREPTSGEELVTINYSDDGRAVLKVAEWGDDFNGTVTAEEIAGEAPEREINGRGLRQTVMINRFTGEYRRSMFITHSTGDSSLLFFGECKPAERKF